MIPDDDRGLLLGDGLFETILAVDGELVLFDEHFERMARGCEVLGIPVPDGRQARRQAEQAMTGMEDGRIAVRLTLTAGQGRGLERPVAVTPRLIATASPSPLPIGPARLIQVVIRRNPTSPASRLKTLAYLDNVLARAEARAAGADEALMLNTRGEVACAAAANLFWISDGRLVTPALSCGILAGIARGQILAAAVEIGVGVSEAVVQPDALEAVEGMFLTNSLMGVREVSELDGRPIPSSALTAELSSRCR